MRRSGPGETVSAWQNVKTTDARIQARDAALRLLNRLTAGVAFAAVTGVGILGLVSAETYPSTSTTTTSSSTTSTSVTSAGLQSTSTPTSASSGGGVAVSGGS